MQNTTSASCQGLTNRTAALVAKDAHARQVLEQIASDEARHAELAWCFVAWALHKDSSLSAVLEHTLAEAHASARVPPEREAAATHAALHAAGRLTGAERAALAREALSDVVKPCWRSLV